MFGGSRGLKSNGSGNTAANGNNEGTTTLYS